MEIPDTSKLVHNSLEYQLCFMHALAEQTGGCDRLYSAVDSSWECKGSSTL